MARDCPNKGNTHGTTDIDDATQPFLLRDGSWHIADKATSDPTCHHRRGLPAQVRPYDRQSWIQRLARPQRVYIMSISNASIHIVYACYVAKFRNYGELVKHAW